MRWIHCLAFMAVIGNYWTKAEDTNEISEKQPSTKIDNNLRKALIKALSDLETGDKTKIEQALEQSSKEIGTASAASVVSESFANGFFQKAPASTFSIITQSSSSEKPTEKTSTTTKVTEKPIVVVQKSNGIEQKPITSYITVRPEFDPINDSEQFVASASSSFTASPKFPSFKSNTPQARSVTQRINPNLVSITEKPRGISPPPDATTATPVITSSTEESEAKVEDVQFFAAPLVAAFTVHHDEQGLPKSVEPIYKVPGQNSVTTKELEQRRLKQLETQRQKEREEQYKQEQIKLQEYLRHQEQLRLQFDLEEKQRILEQQIRSLQQQQQHQDYILRQQQLFQEQSLLQQRGKLLEEQKTLLKTQQNVSPTVTTNRNNFNNQFRNRLIPNETKNKGVSSSVTFEPSITFQPAPPPLDNTLLPPVTQHLPIKSAQNFQQTQFPQFPLKTTDDFRQPLFPPFPEQPFAKFNSISTQQSLPIKDFQNFNFRQNIPQGPQSNRVFRHETGTGNFLNSDFNNRNLFNPNPHQFSQSNRFFRSNPDTFSIVPSVSQDFSNSQNFRVVQPPVVNHQLNNLLYYSGITKGNQQEDFNIVSKVLSLNHLGGGDNFFGASQNIEQRLIPPKQNTLAKS